MPVHEQAASLLPGAPVVCSPIEPQCGQQPDGGVVLRVAVGSLVVFVICHSSVVSPDAPALIALQLSTASPTL
eukprot:8899615-Lingulodinium_polyedra.AAC.1